MLKERNMLQSEKMRAKSAGQRMLNPMRITKATFLRSHLLSVSVIIAHPVHRLSKVWLSFTM